MGKCFNIFGPVPTLALFLVPWVIMLFWRRPLFLVLLWPVLYLLKVLLPYSILNSIVFHKFHNLHILPMDLATFFTVIHLTFSAAFRSKDFASSLKENIFLTIFILLIGIYIVACTSLYGKSAIGEGRKLGAYFFFPLLTMVSIKEPKDLRQLISTLIFVAAFSATVSIVGIFVSKTIYKVISAEACLNLTLVAFSILVLNINGIIVIKRSLDKFMILMFFMLVFLNQHRSVWLAGMVGFILLLRLYRIQILSFQRIVYALILISGLFITAIIIKPDFGSSLVSSFQGFTDPSSDRTASWRMEGWKQQIDRVVRTKKVIFGEGVGGYYSWIDRGVEITVSPHNGYVQIFLKMGLVGLTIYALFVLTFFRKTLHVRKKIPPGYKKACLEIGIVNIVAAHAYMIPYGIPLFMLIFCAVSMSAIKLQLES